MSAPAMTTSFRQLAGIALVLGTALTSGCASKVYVPVLEPAMVNIPPEIQTVGIIDRSSPANLGESVLGTIEGVITGESILGDREGAAQAIDSLVVVLEQSPRFKVVIPSIDKKEADSGIFDKELSHRAVKKICKEAGCDALISLEAFDSDSNLSINGIQLPGQGGGPLRLPSDIGSYVPNGSTEVTVSRDTKIITSWRMYDVAEDRILDETRDHNWYDTWDTTGATAEEAWQNVPTRERTVMDLAARSGYDYGRRIAPTWINVKRKYYGTGNSQLKLGKRHVKARDFEGAKEVWKDLLDSDNPRLRGKAEYDLALALEVEGALPRALARAKEAAVDLGTRRARIYVLILEDRVRDQEKLEAQLAPPPPEEEKKPEAQTPPPAPGERPTVDQSKKPHADGTGRSKPSGSGSGNGSGGMTRPR